MLFRSHEEVRKYIYDIFAPLKLNTSPNDEFFELPAHGLNSLPACYFMNAKFGKKANMRSGEEHDFMNYSQPQTTRKVRKGEELLFPAKKRGKVDSASGYDMRTEHECA